MSQDEAIALFISAMFIGLAAALLFATREDDDNE